MRQVDRDRYWQFVRQGCEVFNTHYPGWRERVDLSTLDLGNKYYCVAGQMTGHAYDDLCEYIEEEGYTPEELGLDWSVEILYEDPVYAHERCEEVRERHRREHYDLLTYLWTWVLSEEPMVPEGRFAEEIVQEGARDLIAVS